MKKNAQSRAFSIELFGLVGGNVVVDHGVTAIIDVAGDKRSADAYGDKRIRQGRAGGA